MSRYARLLRRRLPQSEPLNTRQVQNNAGGYVFALDDWKRLERFLILGSDSSTYYQKAKDLTPQNAACVKRCWEADPARTVGAIVDISTRGRAPKNDAAIFALALGTISASVEVRRMALGALQMVCRTATHLFMFCDLARTLGKGRGRAFNSAIKQWYLSKSPEKLAYQMVKYRSRENYSHRRLLQTARPKTGLRDEARGALFRWGVGKMPMDAAQDRALPELVKAHVGVMLSGSTVQDWVRGVREYGLPWEGLPTAALKEPEVWRALLPSMGITALIRNLGNMTRLGVLAPLVTETRLVAARLTSGPALREARVHPYNLLVALKTYQSGVGFRGQNNWNPVPALCDALEAAFYLSFGNWEPMGKKTLLALDVSGSMTSPLNGGPLSVCEGAAAMLMTVLRTEQECHPMAFHHGLEELPLTAHSGLDGVLKKTTAINSGGTDCALPMTWAKANRVPVEVFQVYTDNETWIGDVHPMVALYDYRQAMGLAAKLVVVGMTSTGFMIADPEDGGSLDVVGFDAAAPAVISDFGRS